MLSRFKCILHGRTNRESWGLRSNVSHPRSCLLMSLTHIRIDFRRLLGLRWYFRKILLVWQGKNIFRGLFLSRPWYYGYKILDTSVFDGKYIQFIYQRRRNMLPFEMIMNFKFNPPIKNSSLVFFERMGNIQYPLKQTWLYRWIIPEFSGRWMNLILFTKATNLE